MLIVLLVFQSQYFDIDESPLGDTMDLNVVVQSDSLQPQGHCMECHRCSEQNGVRYGVVPLSPIKLFTGEPTYWEQIPDIIQTRLIRQSDLPNFLGLRIPVHTQLNVAGWRSHLPDYYDQHLIDLIEFGFPLDFDRTKKTWYYQTQSYFGYQKSITFTNIYFWRAEFWGHVESTE